MMMLQVALKTLQLTHVVDTASGLCSVGPFLKVVS